MNSATLWTLIGLQIAMGLFDTLYHHEFTERLAWRPSQRRELQLHALRNFLYCMLFLLLGWAEVHGWFAWAVIGALTAEVVVTLMDFVEEDMSRRLPATERVTHTLLALNYGGILVLLLPLLIAWTAEPTGVELRSYGFWSLVASLAGIGTLLFAMRDWAASARARRIQVAPAANLAHVLPHRMTILVTGATGFIGSRLSEALVEGGHEVIVLVRDCTKIELFHPPFRLITSLDQLPDDARIDAIVNLAGEPIGNGLWTYAKRTRIIASRLRMTEAVIGLIERLAYKPSVLVSGSAIGWYGLRGDEQLTEDAEDQLCFANDVCVRWEHAARRAEHLGVRVVLLRTGLVLGTTGGMLGGLLTPFEFGLGGPIGSGQQWMSWIERDDLVRLIAHAIATPSLRGPMNATAPDPVRNEAFAAELGRALNRPALLRMPAAPLRLFGGGLAEELLLAGQRVVPAKAEATGFVFNHATLRSALSAMLGSRMKFRSDHGVLWPIWSRGLRAVLRG